MLDMLTELLRALSPAQRRRFGLLQLLVVLRTFAEIAAVAAIGPFTMLVSNMESLQGNGWMARLYGWSAASTPGEFLILLGLGALAVLLLASVMSIYTTYALFQYSHVVGAEISVRLFDHYMHQPWLFHASRNSSLLTKRIAVEATRITKGILTPLMQLNAALVLALFMSIALFLIEPVITLAGVLLFSAAYLAAYGVLRRRIARDGKSVSKFSALQFKLMSEGFGGIREVLLLDSQQSFVDRFEATAVRLSGSQARNSTLAQAPKYLVELAALSSVIFAVIYLVRVHDGNIALIVPLISMYGLAAFKLLPAFQKVYSSYVTMKGAQAAFTSLREDLRASLSKRIRSTKETAGSRSGLRDSVALEDIGFTYPAADSSTLDGLHMKLRARSLTGLVGSSGAGKSTLVDILLGLVEPQRGRVLVDGTPLEGGPQRDWRRSVGFVPQNIYLADASIAENIAFGVPEPEIDSGRLNEAIRLARLEELVGQLPEGPRAQVGERGVQLSGGQRQRIGIARALYRDPDILILDEATNALDVVTEKHILDAVLNASLNRTTLIVAHRLNTLKLCETIYFMKGGKIVDCGTYDELVRSNEDFRQLDLLS